jgi:hypothetical protein
MGITVVLAVLLLARPILAARQRSAPSVQRSA